MSVAVTLDRQLRQRPGGGAEHRHGAVQDVERRLVAGADELPLGGAVEADRAAGVGAHLGQGDEPVRRDLSSLR